MSMILEKYKQNETIRNQMRAAEREKYLKGRVQPLIIEKTVEQNKINFQNQRPHKRDDPDNDDKWINARNKDKISEPTIANEIDTVKRVTTNDSVPRKNATTNDKIIQKKDITTQSLSIGSRETIRRTYARTKRKTTITLRKIIFEMYEILSTAMKTKRTKVVTNNITEHRRTSPPISGPRLTTNCHRAPAALILRRDLNGTAHRLVTRRAL